MATGLIPHYSVSFPLEGVTKNQFIALIFEVAKKLNWQVKTNGQDGFIAFTQFRRNARSEKILFRIENDLVDMKSESMGGQFVDWGRNKRNISSFISGYDELRASLSPEELEIQYEELDKTLGLDENKHQLPSGMVDSSEQTKGFLSLFIPVKGYFITPILIDLNILVFILMAISGVNLISPDNGSLLKWGANFRPYTLDGQVWRLFTNFFLHIGIIHLLFNMYALLYIGILLEPRLGSWRFGLAYMVTGLLASLTSLYWHALTISAGASGAIFGMYGVFLAMLTTNLIEKTQRKALLTSIGVFVAYNLLNGLHGGIDNAAHIGGLISGLLLGYSFYPGLTHSQDSKLNYGIPVILIIVLFGFSFWAYGKISNDVVTYDKKIKSFFSMESQAMEVLGRVENTPRDQLLTEIKERSLYYWNEDKNLIVELDKLDLPPEIHKRNKKLIRYCDLRISSFGLLYKSIAEDTGVYNDQIKAYSDSINVLVGSLK